MFSFIIMCFLPALVLGSEWVERVMGEMSLEEKVGQLFVMPISGDHVTEMEELIGKYPIGNVIVKSTWISDSEEMIDWANEVMPVMPFVMMDAEWGLGMRLKDAESFPKNQELGRLGDEEKIYQVGLEIGRQLKDLGAHISLGPVLDVNNNPDNPIINVRSFGDDPELVAKFGALMVRGLQDGGVLACGKHFPGHGNVNVDSHKALPILPFTMQELDAIELVPFRQAILGEVDAIMSGHLAVPLLSDKPATLSKEIIQELLVDEMGFEGLIITDALNMDGLAKLFSCEEIALEAFRAGHHLLLYGDHIYDRVEDILVRQIPIAYKAILENVSEEEIDKRVRKILEKKEGLLMEGPPKT